MANLTIKLTNRSPKQPVKGLPASIDVPADATFEDLKKLIAKTTKAGDFNRVGIFDPETRKTVKNRNARLVDQPGIAKTNEVLVKDLGLQVAWRTVFIIEYLGPILAHFLVVALRPYLYKNGDGEMSQTQWMCFAMFVAHFLKREVETMFVHKFSASTMPAFNIVRNSAFYWAFAGFLCALSIYRPTSLAATADQPIVDIVGSLIFLFGEICNGAVHWYLSSLRPAGSTERKIPSGYGFSLVTCPNYMYEVISWLGAIIVSRDWSVVVFISVGMMYMFDWGKGKERAYRKEFPDKYKKKRYVMLPGLL